MSKETCELPWYRAFSAGCTLAAATTIAPAAGFTAFGAVSAAALASPIFWAAVGGFLVAGAAIGRCACRISGRLQMVLINPPRDAKTGQTTIAGELISVGRSDPLKPFGDGDWLFNVATRNRTVLETAWDGSQACVRTEDPPDFLHCEISSAIGNAGCVGRSIGAVVGAVVGTVAGAAVGAIIIAGCALSGPFIVLCIIAAAILALIIAAVIAIAAGLVGEYIGKLVGAGIDAATNPPGLMPAEAAVGACVVFSGRWVTDRDHGWNELHDIETAMVLDAGGAGFCSGDIGAAGVGIAAPRHANP